MSQVARILRSVLPAPIYRSLEMYVGRRRANRWLALEGVLPLAFQVAERFDYRVQSGPFVGLKYTKAAVLSRHATPALLGTYEHQLYPFLETAVARSDLVVDIGSAEGYYAVGLALRGKPVLAFDADPHERRICRGMAAENLVSNLVNVKSWCSGAALLNAVKNRRALIISDIDGGELSLFSQEVIAGVRHCDLIIELHGTPDENRSFIQRFDDRVSILDHPNESLEIGRLAFLGPDAARMATEYRPHQQWLLCPGDPGAQT